MYSSVCTTDANSCGSEGLKTISFVQGEHHGTSKKPNRKEKVIYASIQWNDEQC